MANERLRRLYVVDYLVTPDERIENAAVLCENEKIIAVGGLSGFSLETQLEVLRFENAYMTPGFIDTHIHGAGGCDCSALESSPRTLEDMCLTLCRCGVTGFLPTVVSNTPDAMISNLGNLVSEMSRVKDGAEPLGVHVEGPFLNPCKSGSQPAELLSEIDLKFAEDIFKTGNGKIKTMTFAPELANSDKLIELMLQYNVIPSMGHSIADADETLRAIDAGAVRCTHLFNGMQPLHQRDLGLASIVLTDNRVTAELIIDGRHVHPRMVDLACRCKRADRIVGISDGTMAAMMPDGEYHIGKTAIKVINGFSQTASGALAGTTTMLNSGWHSLMSSGHLAETRAARAVTANPASELKLEDRGLLRPGLRADLAVFERGTNRLLMTVVRGKIVYRNEE